MTHRLRLAIGLAAALASQACLDRLASGTVSDAPSETAAGDSLAASDSVADVGAPDVPTPDAVVDGPVMGLCCETDGECGVARRCVSGICLDAPAAGRCWDVGDCAPGQQCLGVGVCPCGAACEQWFDGPGYCRDPGQQCLAIGGDGFGGCEAELGYAFDGATCRPLSGCDCYGLCDHVYGSEQECQQACGLVEDACCASDTDCAGASVCETVGAGTDCVAAAGPARCWHDAECASGETCFGAFICGCDTDCDGPDASGLCVADQTGCTPVPPEAVLEVCNAASIVVFDGTSCVQTAPGACGCDYFCSLTFDSMEQCQAACGG